MLSVVLLLTIFNIKLYSVVSISDEHTTSTSIDVKKDNERVISVSVGEPESSPHQTSLSNAAVSTDCGCSEGISRSSYTEVATASPNSVSLDPKQLAVLELGSDVTVSREGTMIVIPEGTFYFGTDNPKISYDNEGPKIKMHMKSFLIDKYEVSNLDYQKFVRDTAYVTESEKFGWSFVIETAIPPEVLKGISQAVVGAEWWLPVNGAFWYQPEGPGTDVFSSLNYRGNHAVTQVKTN
jgi:formylglycine-generating enzyme required for sulfatase activity